MLAHAQGRSAEAERAFADYQSTHTAHELGNIIKANEYLLLTHRDEVLSRQQMIDSVWPKDVIVTDRAVDVNIARLRKKIGRYGQLIVARQGFGYCFRSEE